MPKRRAMPLLVVLLAACAGNACGLLVDSDGLSDQRDAGSGDPDVGITKSNGPVDADGGASVDTGTDADADAGVVDDCPPPGDATECDGGTLWRGRCYWVPPGTLRRGEIAVACGSDSYPVTVTCAEEWAAIQSLGGVETAWLGNTVNQDQWAWPLGEPFAFTAWAPGHPIVGDGGDWCINWNKFSMLWQNEVACSATRMGICERGPRAQ